nr:EOG090X04YD [Triops cancriformis]
MSSRVISDLYGEIVGNVSDTLFMRGTCTLSVIQSFNELPVDKIKQALAVLVQQNLVTFAPSTKNPNIAEYMLQKDYVSVLIRVPKYAYIFKTIFDNESEIIADELIQQGQDTLSNLVLKSCKRINEDPDILADKPVTASRLLEKINTLVQNNFLRRCPALKPPEQNKENVPKMCKVPVLEDNDQLAFLVPHLDMAQLTKHVNNKELEARNMPDADIYWKINHLRCDEELRNSLLVHAVTRRIDAHAGELVKAILSQVSDSSKPWPATSGTCQLHQIRSYLNKTNPQSTLLQYLDQYFKVVEEDSTLSILSRVGETGGGSYAVTFKKAWSQMTWATLDSIIVERFGSKAARIFRLTRTKNYVEQEQLQSLSMIPAKEAKLYSYRLLEHNYLQVKELRKASGTGPTKSFFLFHVDQNSVVRTALELCFKSVYNMISRHESETKEHRRLLEKQQRVKAILANLLEQGATEEQLAEVEGMISDPERNLLDKVENLQGKLMLGGLHVEDTLFVLETFVYYSKADGGVTQDSHIMVGASMHKNLRTTVERIEKFVSPLYFTDVNLYGKLYSATAKLDGIFHSSSSKQDWKTISFKDVSTDEFTPIKIGDSFGPTWSTHWFKLVVSIPEKWVGKEIHLCWNSSAEAMLWDAEGNALQAYSGCPDRQIREEYVISRSWDSSVSGNALIYYIEMACLDMFGAGNCGMIAPPDPTRHFTLNKAHIAVFEPEYYKLYLDLTLLHDFAKELTSPSERGCDQRGYQALYAANDMINKFQAGQFKQALQIGDQFFSVRNGGKAHRIMAMGHCHIDSAWLWPYDETIRKCARSWVSTLGLLEEFPEMKFTCSQAQQFDWVRQYYPALFERIRAAVKQGRFIPVGGTWVEMDGNIPSGESFIRQFLYGQNFFKQEFDIECQEFWLPDTFGYSAQIPQIIKHVGIERFLTQKLSWSLVNKFPHHNFWWEGIDGSKVLVHFPPGDSYEANCKVGEALKTERNLADKGRASVSMLLYGYGDGGGGPTRAMVQRLERLRDVDGCPPMEHGHPHTFFETLEKDGPKLCTWVGELYLELHNGTYTSQAAMKELNRRSELALRDAEFFLCLALSAEQKDFAPLLAQIDDAWKKVLLNQFHDVLPGSSIQKAHEDARQLFKEALATAHSVRETCLKDLGLRSDDLGKGNAVFNTLPWEREIVVPNPYRRLKISSMTYAPIPEEPEKNNLVSLEQRGGLFIVENPHFVVKVDHYGRVVSLFHKRAGLEAVTESSNQLLIFEDIPLYWDAWDCMDYHLETRQPLNGNGHQKTTLSYKKERKI